MRITTNHKLQEDIVTSEVGEMLSTNYGDHACQIHVGKFILRYQIILWNEEHMMESCNY